MHGFRIGVPLVNRCTRIWCVRPVRGSARTTANFPRGAVRLTNRFSTLNSVTAGAPSGSIACFNQIGDSQRIPWRASGASTVVVSHSGQPFTMARYSFLIRRRCIARPKRRAAAALFAIRTRPLVSRSSRLTIETRPPFTNSKASNSRSPAQRVGAPLGLLG